MSNLPFPAPGDKIVADHPDALATVLNAALGLTVRSQTALGRIELPSVASHPASPANYSMWVRSDLGIGGRLFMRHSNGQNVPYLPLRQEVLAASDIGTTVVSTSFADVPNATLSITTTGGAIRIQVVGNDVLGSVLFINGSASGSFCEIKPVVDSTDLAITTVGSLANETLWLSWPEWRYRPTAGTHTVKLQSLVCGGGATFQAFGRLVVTEYGDA